MTDTTAFLLRGGKEMVFHTKGSRFLELLLAEQCRRNTLTQVQEQTGQVLGRDPSEAIRQTTTG